MNVALYMSAWIEISLIGKKQSVVDVALYMSAWIEIIFVALGHHECCVALYMSAWIEMRLCKHSSCRYWSHST